ALPPLHHPPLHPFPTRRSSDLIRGPKQSRTMRELLGLGMDDPFFPVDIDDLPAQLSVGELQDGSDEQIGRFRVRAASIFHPAPALAFRIEADGHAFVYATDTADTLSGEPNP